MFLMLKEIFISGPPELRALVPPGQWKESYASVGAEEPGQWQQILTVPKTL